MRPWSASPAELPEQSFQVLAGRDQQCFAVDLPEPSESEPAQPVPVLRFAEQRLDPDAPFPHRLLVGGGLVVVPDPVQIRLVEAAGEDPTLRTVGALRLEGAGSAGAGRRLLGPSPGGVVVA